MQDLRDAAMQCLMTARTAGKPVAVVVADSTSTSKIAAFEKAFPQAVINVGIAEQNMVGVAAGLALSGKIAFTANASPFLLARANEQVKNDVCYSALNVNMLGLNAGFAYGPLGATHHCTNDIALLRSMGNVHIYTPGDAIEAAAAVEQAISIPDPVYIRMDSDKLPLLHHAETRFTWGEPLLVHASRSSRHLVFALGTLVHEAMTAVQQGADVSVVSLPSLYPLDEAAVVRLIAQHQQVITLEEHALCGGLSHLISDIMRRSNQLQPLVSFGIPAHTFAHSGARPLLRREYRIDGQSLYEFVTQ